MGPFDYLNSVSKTKENIWTEASPTEYVPFLVNRGLSYFVDCVMSVNEMNMASSSLEPKMQYDYYMHCITPFRRYSGKWGKKIAQDEIETISNVLQVNRTKARQIFALLTEEQMKCFKTAKGGTENANAIDKTNV